MGSTEYGVAFHGPFVRVDAYRLTVDGFQVPYIEAFLVSGTEDTWYLVLDRRMSTEAVSGEAIRQLLPLFANAMAVAAGYPCHGATRPANPFAVGMIGIAPAGDGTFARDEDDWTLPEAQAGEGEAG